MKFLNRTPVISLLTDFGLVDSFVAEMKGVILSICPSARIVDVTHQVGKFDVRMGAFLLACAAPAFPAGSVHVAVVDPGVGGGRRPIVIETKRSAFVGPDNGLLILAAEREGIVHVYELTNRSMMRGEVSATFHGRDVFAPAAAYLACGTPAEDCGVEISDYARPAFGEPKFEGAVAICEVFHIDGFGNIITNLTSRHLPRLGLRLGSRVSVRVGRRRLRVRFVRSYSELRNGEFGFLVESHGFLEIALREASGAKKLHVRSGVAVRIVL